MSASRQISRRQRKHAMVRRQAKKFGPVHGIQIAIGKRFRDALESPLRREVAQSSEFVASLG